MNVFLVTSPLQYICANEARLAYTAKKNLLIIINQDNPTGRIQMSSVINEGDWDYTLYFDRNKRTTTTPKIIKSIKKLSNGNLDTLFYSEYNAWRSKLIIKNLEFKKHIFFDDGTMTFFDYYDHIKDKGSYHRKRLVQDMLLRTQGVKPIGILPFFENTEIFSIFRFPECNIKYRENTLTHLRNSIDICSESFKSYSIFIGQGSIDEKDRISLSEYLLILKKAISNAKYPLLYIPHRTEASHVSDEIKKLHNLVYHKPTFPIEIELFKSKITPVEIIGLSSTALYTLSIIYPNSIISTLEIINPFQTPRDKRISDYLSDYFNSIKNKKINSKTTCSL
ncbi:hypothetical protein NF212_15795 [Parasalinivibrio latis]|uniref:hypothetical protein n=1 Tax=Parasalinivibrio latis TaxID=2952610 RepID=UPI0030E18097